MTQAVAERRALPRLSLLGVFGGLFAGYLGLTAAIPVLPGFVRDRLGGADVAVGIVVTATALTALLTRPIAGALADRHGYRRVMQTGAVLLAIGGGLYFLPLAVPGLIAVRLLLGIGEASLFTAGAVWTVSLAPHERRGQLIGLYGVSMWGGISLGTAAGAALRQVGYGPVWAFCAVLPLAALALISAVPAGAKASAADPGSADPGATPADGANQSGQRRSLAALLPRGRDLVPSATVLPGTALALAAAGYSGLAAFVILMLRSRGIGSGVVVLTGFSAVYAGTRLFIGHLPDRLGPRRVAAASGVGEAIGLLIIAAAPNLPVALAGGLVMGVGFSLLHPSLALMVMNRTDKSRQGAALGAYTSFWDLGIGAWGPLTGLIAAGLGYTAVFVTAAACAAGAAALALWIDR